MQCDLKNMGGISNSLILTGIIWFAYGIWTGHAINLDYNNYIWCLPGGWSEIGGGYIKYACQTLYLYNTAPALFIIIGILARIVGR